MMVFLSGNQLLLVCSLGCLQRVDLLGRFFDLNLEVGGRRAFPRPPFSGRIRINPAILARGTLNDLAAPLTLIDNRVTASAVEPASLFRHEAAIDPTFDGLTNHTDLLFLDGYVEFKKTDPLPKPSCWSSQVGHSLLKKRVYLTEKNMPVKKNMHPHIRPESQKM
jgi:hypothetical protein